VVLGERLQRLGRADRVLLAEDEGGGADEQLVEPSKPASLAARRVRVFFAMR
jgi:hypothetical protein